MNNNISIIIGREYWMRVRKKSFFLLTFLMPVLVLLGISIPIIVGKSSIAKEKIAVIDITGQYFPSLKSTEHYEFFAATKTLEAYKEMGRDNEAEITGVLEIRADLLENPKEWSLYAYKQLPSGVTDYINKTLSDYLSEQKIATYDIPNLKEIVQESKVSVSVPTYKWTEEGTDSRTSGSLASVIGIALTMVIFFFINTYGSLVMAGVLEEKKNRIMEVMVSTVKPFDMMMGKIIGIGLVGITQIILWLILFGIIFIAFSLFGLGGLYDPSTLATMSSGDLNALAMSSSLSMEDLSELQDIMSIVSSINVLEIGIFFILFFIGGFMLYASLFAAVGASVSGDEDSNQFIMPVMVIMFIGFYSAFGSMENPEGPLAFWGSIIPFTSPIVMMVRLPYDVPVWQEILSVVILYASFIGITWLSAKIYRVGILLYGKKPTYRDLWKWIKNA